jgi:hypothetical protein
LSLGITFDRTKDFVMSRGEEASSSAILHCFVRGDGKGLIHFSCLLEF